MHIDNPTLALSVGLVLFATSFLTVVWAWNRNDRGLMVYAAGAIGGFFGFLLLLGQGTLSPWLSKILANFLVLSYYIGLAWGLRLRNGFTRAWPRRFSAYLAAFFALFIYASILHDFYPIRASAMSLSFIAFSAEIIAAQRRRPADMSIHIRRAVWVAALTFSLLHALRLVLVAALATPKTSMLDGNGVSAFTLVLSLVYSVLWTGLILIMDGARLIAELQKKNALLNDAATTDALTGLANRRSFDFALRTEMDRAKRYGYPLSIILFDLDHFKIVNDTWGHQVGDEVLRRTADAAKSHVREPDGVFRWGGEEFIVLTPHTRLSGAINMAEKLRGAIAEIVHPQAGSVTASFGVAEWTGIESHEAWLGRVDRSLYQAKNEGRNRVIASKAEGAIRSALVRLQWNGEWESGNGLVDEQHRLLVDMANELLVLSMSSGEEAAAEEQLDRLFAHIDRHFDDEERVLAGIGYPRLAAHRRSHGRLREESARLKDQFRSGSTDAAAFFGFIVDKVIVGHLLAEDILFFPYTRGSA